MLLARTNNGFDTLWNEMFRNPYYNGAYEDNETGLMKTDITETDAGYILDIELPGFGKEDIQAELKDGYLTIAANHAEEKEDKEKDGRMVRQERYHGSCKRSFYVGDDVKQEDIKAAFRNGILKVMVPKQRLEDKKEKPKMITID